MKPKQEYYELSNSIDTVRLNSFDKSYLKRVLNASESLKDRQVTAQALCNYLCKKFGIAYVTVCFANTPQDHTTRNGKLRNKTLGCYYPAFNSIKIFNLTAVRRQTVSIKTFVDTLLHEFMHHYDYEVLNINSLHTAGFYKRITDLKNKLS